MKRMEKVNVRRRKVTKMKRKQSRTKREEAERKKKNKIRVRNTLEKRWRWLMFYLLSINYGMINTSEER